MERERRSEIQISGIKGKGEAESLTVPVIIHPISHSSTKDTLGLQHMDQQGIRRMLTACEMDENNSIRDVGTGNTPLEDTCTL